MEFSRKFSSRYGVAKDFVDVLEYPFLTLETFPEGFIQRLGNFFLYFF